MTSLSHPPSHLQLLCIVNLNTTTPAATMPVTFLRRLLRPSALAKLPFAPLRPAQPSIAATTFQNLALRPLPASRAPRCTLIQVLRQGRISQGARKLRSPQLKNRPELKGVCLKVGTTKPKKPNSGERKIARVRLSTGKVITAYIPGEGMVENGWGGSGSGTSSRELQVIMCSSTRLLWSEVDARKIVLV